MAQTFVYLFFAKLIFERDRHLARLYFHDLRKNRLSVAVCSFVCFSIKYGLYFIFVWGRSDVVVSAFHFRSKGEWFKGQSLPSCCFLRQETPHCLSPPRAQLFEGQLTPTQDQNLTLGPVSLIQRSFYSKLQVVV